LKKVIHLGSASAGCGSLDFTAFLADQNHQPIFKSATKRGCGLVSTGI
jgi:hypothetical protein